MGKIIRALALDKQVKVCFVISTDITNEAIRRHDLWPSAASVLGKVMTISLMMGSSLKDDAALTIKIDANGPIGQVICDADAYGTVRGYVTNPHVNFTKKGSLDEVTTLGYNGYIDVIKDLQLSELFTSSVETKTGNLALDFAYYFNVSEQTPTAILLGSLFDVDNSCKICGGILIQLLPNCSEDAISYLENKISEIKDFSNILANEEDYNNIFKLFFDNNYEVLSEKEAIFYCKCTKEKFKNGLTTLDVSDLEDMMSSDKGAEIVCHYCNNHYDYSVDDLQEIIDIKKNKEGK